MPVGTSDPSARQVLQRVSVAPSPATSGTAFSIDAATDYFFNSFEQTTPFKIAVYPQNELPTKTNSEIILVQAYSASTRTGGVSVQAVAGGIQGQGSVDVQESQPGDSTLAQSEIQTVTVSATSGTYTLTFGGYTTGSLAWNASAATVQTALTGLTSIGASNATVTGSAGGPYTVTFAGSLANAYQALITADATNLVNGQAGTVTVSEVVHGAASAASEVQKIVIYATGGSWKATFGGYTTGSLAYNASATTVQTALQGLASIGSGNVTVSRTGASPTYTFTVTFAGTMANTPQPLFTLNGSSLTFPGDVPDAGITEYTIGTPGGNEVQQITVLASQEDGTFTLTFGGQTTDDLAWNISADSLATELCQLSSIGAGNVEVEGAGGGPYTVTFQGSMANTGQALITADATLLTYAAESTIQTVALDATGGTFKLSADGGTTYTSNINYNASAATVQTALQGLAAIGSGNCTVTLDTAAKTYTVTFCGTLANQAVALLTADAAGLTVATASITSSVRAQDNTTAQSIAVGHHAEVASLSYQVYGAATAGSGGPGGPLAPDFSVAQFWSWEVTGHDGSSLTISNPTNKPGAAESGVLTLYLLDSSGSSTNLTWGADYQWTGSIAKPTSLGAGASITILFVWNPLLSKWFPMAKY